MHLTWQRRSDDHQRRASTFLRGALVFVTALAVETVLLAPLGAETRRTHQSTPTTHFGVGIVRCTFVDRSRSLLDYSTTPFRVLSSSRTLLTEIRYPTQQLAGGPAQATGAPPLQRSGGYPMIVFAHGYDVTPDTYAALLDAWVRAGFVVVAPFFPDENASAVAAQYGADTEDDLANEPGDLAFLTKEILLASVNETTICPIASGLINPSEIALAGHSDGAVAAGMLAYDHGLDPQGINYASLRTGIAYRAIIILSGAEDTAQSYAAEARRPNLLVVQSLTDRCNPFRDGVQLYDGIHQSNKWFLELQSAHHLPPFDDVDVPAFNVVSATTISFLQMSLQDATPTTSLLTLGNQRPEIARIYSGVVGPPLANAPRVKESCSPN